MGRRVVSTYRLQLHQGFRFDDARAIVDYLDALGVSHAYCSPYLHAARGSAHGYDLVDPSRTNPEIGEGGDLYAFADALASRGMGHVLDFVPNHMGIARGENARWEDVLENGPSSRFADWFDIEWDPPKTGMTGKVLLPILAEQYGEALDKQALAVERDGGAFFVRYYERRLPLSPPSVAPLLEEAAGKVVAPDARAELASVAAQLRHLPPSDAREPSQRDERAREKEIAKRRLSDLCRASPEVAAAVDAAVARVNADPDAEDDLLRAQCFRPSFWRVATEEINYRRFFEINDLAAVRMERDDVFDEMHRLPLALMAEGALDGLRLDHVDGLYDPEGYAAKLRAHVPEGAYVIAEKILEPGERLPASWPIDGTTGYDFVGAVTALFVDPASEQAMTALCRDVTGDAAPFADHAYQAKRAIMRGSLSAEIHVLSHALERIALADRRSRDFTLASLTTAIVETMAAFAVYRTYIRPDSSRGDDDEARVRRAVRAARRRKPEMSPTVFQFLERVLLLDGKDREACVRFAMRFQQTTGPVMAKAVEDTAFYTYVRLVALNEVGARPDVYGVTPAAFHAQNAERRAALPRAMTATSTHDTKRGEDVRARLAVLSEMPAEWRSRVEAWRARARPHVSVVDDEPAPSGEGEYLFYQTVVGALPFEPRADLADFTERVAAYMTKAAREAKRRTSWLNPDEAYERAQGAFVRGMLGDAAFVEEARALVRRIAPHAATNGLAMRLLQIASPGVPDNYQGSETWNLALVDPDNRRAVDYARLRARLAALRDAPRGAALSARLLDTFHGGDIKLFVVQAALRLRRAEAALFLDGDYAPIDGGDHVVAFARRHERRALLCAAPRLTFRLTRGAASWAIGRAAWQGHDLAVPSPGVYEDVLTARRLELGPRVRAEDLFAKLPVALLFCPRLA
jgi:(1->4)-alpha-D-glucan 1-alpha-D-glucosylmutase